MPSSLPPGLMREIDPLCDRFEEAWCAGEKPQIEAYLTQVSTPVQPFLLRELICLELELRRAAGPPGALDEYRRRFPEHHTTLEALFPPTAPAEPVFRVVLTVLKGPHAGHSFTFKEQETIVVGRSEEANFPLPEDSRMSRFHFLVEVNPPQCRLVDLKSRNGTLVNGQRVEATLLKTGDRIKTGQTSILVQLHQAASLEGEATAAFNPL